MFVNSRLCYEMNQRSAQWTDLWIHLLTQQKRENTFGLMVSLTLSKDGLIAPGRHLCLLIDGPVEEVLATHCREVPRQPRFRGVYSS